MKDFMKWNNLKNFKCPACSNILDNQVTRYVCLSCHYQISKERFDEIVSGMYAPKKKVFEENLSDLNNLGHDKVTEDFSDSPYLDI